MLSMRPSSPCRFLLLAGLVWSSGLALASAEQTVLSQEELAGRIEFAVAAHAAERLDIDQGDVEVLFLGLGQQLHCSSDVELDIHSSPNERFEGHANIQIKGWDQTGQCAQVRIRPRLRVWDTIPVAQAATAPGQPVTLTMARVDLSHLNGVSVDPESGPWEARISLRAGQPVTLQAVTAVPNARSGDPVTLIAERGTLQITARGRLMDDAFLGETVAVANTTTGTVVEGILLEPDLVEARGMR